MRKPDSKFNESIKVRVVGWQGAGKSALIDQLYARSSSQASASALLQPEYGGRPSIIEVDGKKSDNDLGRDIRPANVVLLAVDLSQPPVEPREIDRFVQGTPKILLVGTKSDDANAKKHPEYEAHWREQAKLMGYSFVQTSAKTGIGVEKVLDQVLNPSIVEKPQPVVANKQAAGIFAKKNRMPPNESLTVTLSNIKVDARSAIATVSSSSLQVMINNPKKNEEGRINLDVSDGNTITMKATFPSTQAAEYRKVFAEQLTTLVNNLQSGVTVTIDRDDSRTLKPALEETLARPYKDTARTHVTIYGAEAFLQEFEKKGSAISSIAGGFADDNVTDAVSLKSDSAFQSQELVAHMKDTDSTITVTIAPSATAGQRKVDIVQELNANLDGKALKELTVVVKDFMDRCQSVAAKVSVVEKADADTGEVTRSDPMTDIKIDTHKTDMKEKVMVDRALKNAGLEAQLQPKEEQREAVSSRTSPHM